MLTRVGCKLSMKYKTCPTRNLPQFNLVMKEFFWSTEIVRSCRGMIANRQIAGAVAASKCQFPVQSRLVPRLHRELEPAFFACGKLDFGSVCAFIGHSEN